MRRLALAFVGLVIAAGSAAAAPNAPANPARPAQHGSSTKARPAATARAPLHRVAARPKNQTTHARLNSLREAERGGYKSVTSLTSGAFPAFYPGLGRVYVRPGTLPVGPFLTFDHRGRQVSTIYMISLEDMNGHKKFDAGGTRTPRVNHVTVYYHGGHPGVDFPHYHYVLWHVSKEEEARVAH